MNMPAICLDGAAQAVRRLDRRWLLALYAVVPLSIGVIVADILVFGRYLQRAILPATPEQWPIWAVVFGLPHVIAGLLTMADREYLGFYRRRCIAPLLLFGTVSLGAAVGPAPFLFAVSIWLGLYTVTHLLSQQIGLSYSMLRTPSSRQMRIWKVLIMAIGLILYVALYLDVSMPNATLGHFDPHALCVLVCVPLLAALAVSTAALARGAVDRCGRYYIWSNAGMMLGVYLAYLLRYPVFILLIPRVVHDLTAYLVYLNHDTNRNATTRHNVLYLLQSRRQRPARWILPAVSIALGFGLQMNDYPPVIAANFFLTFMHYHIESFIWRRPNPHRSFLELS